jgi:hypothetical protein
MTNDFDTMMAAAAEHEKTAFGETIDYTPSGETEPVDIDVDSFNEDAPTLSADDGYQSEVQTAVVIVRASEFTAVSLTPARGDVIVRSGVSWTVQTVTPIEAGDGYRMALKRTHGVERYRPGGRTER